MSVKKCPAIIIVWNRRLFGGKNWVSIRRRKRHSKNQSTVYKGTCMIYIPWKSWIVNNEKAGISDLLHFATHETILHYVFTATIKYRFVHVLLMPKNTYSNSINAQHVATTDRTEKYIGRVRLYFYLVEFSRGATQGYKIRNGREVSANVPSRFISALPRATLASRMQNANPDDKLADRQWFSSYNSISPEFSLFFDIIQRECNFQ